MDVEDIVNKINASVTKYKGKNKEALQKIASDCYLDFLDVLYKDKKRFEKELKQVDILTRTPTDMLIEKAIRKTEQEAEKAIRKAEQKAEKAEKAIRKTEQKAEQKAYEKEVKMVLKMINKNYDDEEIQDLSDFTIQEIANIREEYSNQ